MSVDMVSCDQPKSSQLSDSRHIYLEEIPVRDLMMIKMIRLVRGGVSWMIHKTKRKVKRIPEVIACATC